MISSMTKSIFVNENENIFESLACQGVIYGADIVEHLKFISHKKGNNYIGYYQFFSDEVYYKIYILPKITPRCEELREDTQNFIHLLQEYYRLKSKYEVKSKHITKNIVDFSFDNNKSDKKGDVIDNFIAYKYTDALATVKAFFKKHSKSIYKEEMFSSQNIKQKLDLKRNIVELNKSRIHQKRHSPYHYSTLAMIASEVLHYFIKHKQHNKSEAKKIKVSIDSKYNEQKNTFKINQIVSKKIFKLFKNSDEKALYLALLKLLGAENYFEDNSTKEIFKLYNQHSLFFRPEKLFEWVVYDGLIKKYGKENIRKEPQTKKEYFINQTPRVSNVDFVVRDKDKIIVIDAKWKILKNMEDIKFEDIAKLRRDALLLKADQAILIYPQIAFDEREFKLSVDGFEFMIEKCEIILKNEN